MPRVHCLSLVAIAPLLCLGCQQEVRNIVPSSSTDSSQTDAPGEAIAPSNGFPPSVDVIAVDVSGGPGTF
ncbi:MAG: hypothetical protein VKL39_01450 [Leptolyngbyaceae bacterium]|nr:hypothetical protein [Leptolyngbyaceae bacterium]